MSFLRKVFGSKTQEEKYIGGIKISVLTLMKNKYKKNEEFTEAFYKKERFNLTRLLVRENVLALLEAGLDFNKAFDYGPIFLYCGDKETYEIFEYFGFNTQINLKDENDNYLYDIRWDLCRPFMIISILWQEFHERLVATEYNIIRKLDDIEVLRIIHFDKGINIAEKGFDESFYQNYWNRFRDIFSKYYYQGPDSSIKRFYDFLVNDVKVDFHKEASLKYGDELISLPSWFVYIREFNRYSFNSYELKEKQREIFEGFFNVSFNDKSKEGRNIYFSLLGLDAKEMSSAVKALLKLDIDPSEKDEYNVSFLDVLCKEPKGYASIIRLIKNKLEKSKNDTEMGKAAVKKKCGTVDKGLKQQFGKSAPIIAEFLEKTSGPKSLVNYMLVKDDVENAKK